MIWVSWKYQQIMGDRIDERQLWLTNLSTIGNFQKIGADVTATINTISIFPCTFFFCGIYLRMYSMYRFDIKQAHCMRCIFLSWTLRFEGLCHIPSVRDTNINVKCAQTYFICYSHSWHSKTQNKATKDEIHQIQSFSFALAINLLFTYI